MSTQKGSKTRQAFSVTAGVVESPWFHACVMSERAA